jgi:hypothetical protein
MKRITGTVAFIIFSLSLSINTIAQNIGINTTGAPPNASAILDLSNTVNLGFLAPSVSLTATNAAAPVTSPATGLIVYNTAIAGVSPNNVVAGYYYNSGTAIAPNWVLLNAGNSASNTLGSWLLNGNTGTSVATNFLGTVDNTALYVKTFGTTRMAIMNTNNGNIGIGNTAPNIAAALDITNSNNQGFLPNKVLLTATNLVAPVNAGLVTGLLVYNTNTSGVPPTNVVPGYYYWNGLAWVLFTTYSDYGTNIQNAISDNSLFSTASEGFTTTSTTFVQANVSSLTISAVGTYMILANAEINSSSNNDNAVDIVLEDITNTIYYANSVPYVANWVEWSSSTVVTLTAPATYEIKIASSSNTKTAQIRNARITYIKVQ